MAISIYSDLDYNLTIDVAGKVSIIRDHESIKQSIRTILTTYPGERIMLPEFGSTLRTLLFDPMDDFTAELIEAEIKDNINRWENRIYIESVDVDPDYDRNKYDISITYIIIATSERGQLEGTVGVNR